MSAGSGFGQAGSGGGGGGTITGSGTANYIAKFITSTSIGNGISYDSGTYVSINGVPTGTIDSADKLIVNGTINARNTTKALYLFNDGSTIKLDAYNYGTGPLSFSLGGNGGNITISNSALMFGNVGGSWVGTALNGAIYKQSDKLITVLGSNGLVINDSTNASTYHSFTDTGLVGIGTGVSVPTARLQVKGVDSTTTINLLSVNSSDVTTFSVDNTGIVTAGKGLISNGPGNVADNFAAGLNALILNTTGSQSVAIGNQALSSSVIGIGSTAVGYNALRSQTATNAYNTAIGWMALDANISGVESVAIGAGALSMAQGNFNVAFGASAGAGVVTGTNGTFIGRNAGNSISDASFNTIVGSSTTGITTGVKNTIIGAGMAGLSTSLSNNIIISDGDGLIRLQFDENGLGTITGKLGVSISPTAYIHALGSAAGAANTASLKLATGTLLLTPENGAIENNGTHLYYTIGGVRYQLDQQGGGGTVTSVSGTANRITSTGGATPVIDISASYVGQSSITTLGTVTTGTWNAGVIPGTYGGTGVNNSTRTITIAGNFATTGAFNTTFATGFTGTITLPTATSTLATLALSEAFTNKTYNGLTLTSTTGTFTLTNGKTLAVSDSATIATNAITLGGGEVITFSATNALSLLTTGTTVATLPLGTNTIAALGLAQTWTATQTEININYTNNAITASGNAATLPITHRLHTVTNNSAATLTMTLTTASAVDGQMKMVRILDSSAVAQTLVWVNTENSQTSVPTTSNGSTTLPLTAGFQFNGATSKWRCLAFS